MAEIEYDIVSMDELCAMLKNAYSVYQDEQNAMTEGEYSGIGKVADAMEMLENKENDFLNDLDEMYSNGIALMEYVSKKIQEAENAVSEAVN